MSTPNTPTHTDVAAEITDLKAAIDTATSNIRKATNLGLTRVAQQTRRDRTRMTARLDALTATFAAPSA